MPDLLLGVDRKLVKSKRVDVSGPQTFEFNAFPSERGLKKALGLWWAAFGGDAEG